MKPLRVYTRDIFFRLYDIDEKELESLRKEGVAIAESEFGHIAFDEERLKSFLRKSVSKNDNN